MIAWQAGDVLTFDWRLDLPGRHYPNTLGILVGRPDINQWDLAADIYTEGTDYDYAGIGRKRKI